MPGPRMRGEGQHDTRFGYICVEWLSPPIPNTSGWYWHSDPDGAHGSVQGPFNNDHTCFNDAIDTLSDGAATEEDLYHA